MNRLIFVFILFFFPGVLLPHLSSAQTDLPQEKIWRGITSGGWPKSLGPLQKRFRDGRSYVALYEKLPIWPIDMRSPDRFKRSMGSREFFGQHSIGHMAIGWSCHGGRDVDSVGFTAQTGEDSSQQKQMLDEGWGVTAMISTFTDGRMHTGPQIDEYFEQVYRDAVSENRQPEPFFALVVEVPTSDCESVRDFSKAYVSHPSKPYKNFGMIPDPLKFEGAGCGSFAISALAKAPSLAPIMGQFWRTMPIPEKTLGRRTGVYLPNSVIPAARAKTQKDERLIGLKRLLLMNWDAGKTAIDLRFVDPELSIFGLKKIMALAGPLFIPKSLNRVFNFPGRSGEAATGGIEDNDYGYQEIDAQFDKNFGRVSLAIDTWWNQRASQSLATPVEISHGHGVFIEFR